jgi:hypothetical protein
VTSEEQKTKLQLLCTSLATYHSSLLSRDHDEKSARRGYHVKTGRMKSTAAANLLFETVSVSPDGYASPAGVLLRLLLQLLSTITY